VPLLFTTMRGDVNIFCKFGLAAVILLLFGCANGQKTLAINLPVPNTAATAAPATPAVTAVTRSATAYHPSTAVERSSPDANYKTKQRIPLTANQLDQQTPHKPAQTPNLSTSQQLVHRTDLWQRIRAGFGLPDMSTRFISLQEQWFSKRPDYVERLLQRARRYLPYIVEQVAERGMPMEIALLPAIESAYRPAATSRTRAAGLWQFMPATGRRFDLKQNWWVDQRRDLYASTNAALDYLDYLHQRLNGDWILALAAYNAGEATIERAIRYNRRRNRSTHFTNLRLRLETRQYIPKLIAFRNIINAPENFGLTLPVLPVKSNYARVPLPYQLDLRTAAGLLDMPADELLAVNGNFLRWATPPGAGHSLLIPASKEADFKRALQKLPAQQRIRWAHYRVRKGDTLGGIALRHKVSLAAVKQSNHIRSDLINIGQNLVIPLSEGAITQLAQQRRRSTLKKSRSRRSSKRSFVHQVRNGDTLWGIAKRYRVYVSQLLSWNSLRKNSILRRGQPIRIYAAN